MKGGFRIGSKEEGGGYYKIGYSKNPKKRLSRLQMGNPRKLEIVFRYKTLWFDGLEYYLQQHFRSKWIRGEWYELTEQEVNSLPDVIEEIRRERAGEELEYMNELARLVIQALRSRVQKKVNERELTLDRQIDEMTVDELLAVLNSN